MRSCYKAAVLMMSDPDFRRRLFDSQIPSDALGLNEEDRSLLIELDAEALDVLAAGHSGKRITTLEAALPRTVATLRFHFPGFLESYVTRTDPLPTHEDRIHFMVALSTWHQFDDKDRRFLRDLAECEYAASGSPGTWTSLRGTPASRISRSPNVVVVPLRGPLEGRVEPGAIRPPRDYPNKPAQALVARHKQTLFVSRLEDDAGRVWEHCGEGPTLEDLITRFGPGIHNLLERWLRHGILEIV